MSSPPHSSANHTELSSSPESYREAIARFATGITVITTATADGPAGMTASAVCSLSLEPILLLVCISNRLPTHAALSERGAFAVNVLGEDDAHLARRFATPGVDKFAGVRLQERGGVPVLAAAIAQFTCRVEERLPGGDHSIFVGRVVGCGYVPGRRPLLYFGSSFGSLRPHRELAACDGWAWEAALQV